MINATEETAFEYGEENKCFFACDIQSRQLTSGKTNVSSQTSIRNCKVQLNC